jgi:hypothetical protein
MPCKGSRHLSAEAGAASGGYARARLPASQRAACATPQKLGNSVVWLRQCLWPRTGVGIGNHMKGEALKSAAIAYFSEFSRRYVLLLEQ